MARLSGVTQAVIHSLLFFPLFIITSERLAAVGATDITKQVFSNINDGIVAAFGDFNSDEFTDVFILRNDTKTLQILLGAETEPLLRPGPKCDFKKLEITSVVPGDFDGDAYMDVLITTRTKKEGYFDIYVNWGRTDYLNCTDESEPLLTTYGEPLAIDYNNDMIIDLFGTDDPHENRYYYIFQNNRGKPERKRMVDPGTKGSLRFPNSNAYLDVNRDFTADLFIETNHSYEIWTGLEGQDEKFIFSKEIKYPIGNDNLRMGQSVFLDMELKGSQNHIVPVCFDRSCNNATIMVYDENHFTDLHISLKDPQGSTWGFIVPDKEPYTNAITARGGDFNMDGYPDLLITLKNVANSNRIQTFLLENVPCTVLCKPLSRTFEVKWDALSPMGNNTVAGTFYDFYQDGVLDVMLIEKVGKKYRPLAFRNTLDYDANFVKVIVLTGLTNKKNETTITALGRKKRTYGTNLPGPRIVYFTTTQEGDGQHGSSSQLPQSAYFALQLPYTIFGLGRTPNFVDSLTVGLSNKSRTWTQLIPNSQMIVVPRPVEEPLRWKAQLFVTPSKLILMSVVALGGTCFVITLIILGLYIKEKREDKQEKLQEAHRFHFDAM